MRPARLADLLRSIADDLDDGTYEASLQRTYDWADATTIGTDPGPLRCPNCIDQPTPCDACVELAHTPRSSDRDRAERKAISATSKVHDRITAAHRALVDTAAEMVRLLTVATPDRQVLRPATPTDYAIAGWCRSCARNDGHLSPIAVHPDGRRRYADWCNGCGTWAHDHNGQPPPLEILQLRHAGKRVTAADYERIMGRPPAKGA